MVRWPIGSQYDTIFSYYLHKNSLVQGEIQSVVLDQQDSHSNNKWKLPYIDIYLNHYLEVLSIKHNYRDQSSAMWNGTGFPLVSITNMLKQIKHFNCMSKQIDESRWENPRQLENQPSQKSVLLKNIWNAQKICPNHSKTSGKSMISSFH